MEDFVTFEIAKKLKEKGFREECFAYYTSEYTLYNNLVVLCDDKYLEVAEIDYTESLTSNNSVRENKYNNICDAPTISQVLKWLRENKKIYVAVYYVPVIETINNSVIKKSQDFYYPTIQKIGDFEPTIHTNGNDCFSTYEEAALAGIEYTLDNLI